MFNKFTTTAVLAAALVTGLCIAGCGGSGDSTTTTAAISKAEFLSKGNAICIRGNKQTGEAFAGLAAEPSSAQIKNAIETGFVPAVQGQIDGIRALGAPRGDEAKVEHMLDLAQEDLDEIKRDPVAYAEESNGGERFADFAALAHPYGLTHCAEGS
jgi:hypothetical protein